MLYLDNEVDVALKADAILADIPIYEFYEAGDRTLPYPRIIYEEISNVPDYSADDAESVSRITYRVSVCAESNIIEIINAVERAMISINFCRHSADNIRGLPLGVKGKVILFITKREC